MRPNAKVKPFPLQALLVMAIPLLGLLQTSSAQALSLTPLKIENIRGQLEIGNKSDRSIQIQLQVFSQRQVGGIKTAGVEPLGKESADKVIRLRRSVFRLGPGSTRLIPYRIVSPSQPFYVCGTSLQGLFNVRVCSRWEVSASLVPGPQRP